jgi:hypothetical protein
MSKNHFNSTKNIYFYLVFVFRETRYVPRYIFERVSASSEYQHGNVKGSYEFDAIGMSLHAEIETSESIPTERIGSTLHDDRPRPEIFHDFGNDRFKNGLVGFIVHAIVEGKVDSIILARSVSRILHVSGSGEVFTKFMETACHDAIGTIESFFDAISVVNVNVYVQDAFVHLEQFEYGQDAIVDVTKAGCFGFFGVVESPGPIDDNVGRVFVETRRSPDRTGRVELTKFVQSIKDWTIFPDVEAL